MSNITKLIPEFISELADADLQRRVVAYLASRHLAALRLLEVEARNGTVTLSGKVHSFYEKQLTQQCSRRVAGVVRLVDRVDVATAQQRETALIPIPPVVSSAAIAAAL